ncbi:MAG: hypothetical protein ABFS45_21435, partial [Pseudomonadota bacterium]
HGLSNKPALEDLRRIWLDALAVQVSEDSGFDLGAVGVRDSFVYWADLFYDEPLLAAQYESRSDELTDSVDAAVELASDEWIDAMRVKFPMEEDQLFDDAPLDDSIEEYERIPLPWPVKKQVIKHFLKEAHDYLFNVDGIRDRIRKQVMDALARAGDDSPLVLVGHSQGSFIAYDVLTGVEDCPVVDGLLTLGSPLGIDEVQDKLVWSREDGFPKKLQGSWVNVYDPYDVVARLDPKLSNDFRRNGEQVVIDIKEENWGTWRHSATKYLQGPMLRSHLRRLAGRV